ncbi:MAG TPA: hypothetical protein VMW80_14210, partial [Candidatus Dormibacteraeota bacterium]|nr:hypothetical protein [Candidatus Dormibacteraeota bacterium]
MAIASFPKPVREDIARLRDEWLANGLSTVPVDRANAQRSVEELYLTHELPKPALYIWMDSPLGGCLGAAAVKQLPELWGQLGGQLGEQLGEQLWGQLRGQLGDQLWEQLREQLGGQLGGQLWEQLGDQLREQLGEQLREQLRGQLW